MLFGSMIYQVTATPAPAGDPAAAPDLGGAIMQQLLFIAPIILIFYFLLIRPQQNRQKKMREMLEALKKGDSVVTSGGIIGKILKIEEGSDEVTLDTGEGGKLRVLKAMIVDVRNKMAPAPANDVKES